MSRKFRWFLSTESVGLRRLSLIGGIVLASYKVIAGPEWARDLFTYYIATSDTHAEPRLYGGVWGGLAAMVLAFLFYFLCAWVLVRIAAWVAFGFIADRSKKSN